MANFKINDRVFDIRYGWGTVIGQDPTGAKHIKFDTNETIMMYSKEFINTILSYSEYGLVGQTLPDGATDWDDLRDEWMNNGENIELFTWLTMNFELPVRK